MSKDTNLLDPTTQSNYTEAATRRVHFDWVVDFATRTISGFATHMLDVLKDGVSQIIFDAADLDISAATVNNVAAQFTVGPKHEVMGSALSVTLPSAARVGQSITVKITYKTTPDCTALQWLEKEQTQGKQFPYLFSQCQPIYARSVAPLQDTPSLKITYSAKVDSVLPVLLSARRVSPPSVGPPHGGKIIGKDVVSYVYDQPVGIPSYLIAIACGNVVYRAFPSISGKEWTSGIWAEPEMIEAAYWEFSEDTARYLAKEETIVGDYRFGVYDLLVLPPSFPYGGMENACLSFLTPTLLAGDRTLVDVVVHEMTHSFFGNGVTHAHASHFWLNEGWTTYMERLLLQFIHTPADRGFSYLIGSKALKDALLMYEDQPKYQRLVLSFEIGEDPDAAYSNVPYEKGSNFIYHIEEQTVGGLDAFLPYVRDYVSTFMGQSITTDQWKNHLFNFYTAFEGGSKIPLLNTINWDAWLYGEGLTLPVEMTYDASLAEQANALAERWDKARSVSKIEQLDFTEQDLDSFNSSQIMAFLERIQAYTALPLTIVQHLGKLYKLDTSSNAEIRFRFYQVALQDPQSDGARMLAPEAISWVIGEHDGVIKGRMKFCRPIFRSVVRVDRALAQRAFETAQNEFHPIARKMIKTDLAY
ncbi:hypothetical protein FISHEDRAFT_78691 [Fistulina hepatica ATCC 64428]|uniref:Peptidase M1 leukotriene A4 hydrolase/aminopeptidase C-terminal domain-containing protein n=1 Tax=Fistulina hepatica ATCC 64428 TaxID=1128425 RepID=A0A0D7A078_9AGAR|nr:hypothetical protein FISHEDRAFT_78691 [Fistulina hepatica ATCC 64428]